MSLPLYMDEQVPRAVTDGLRTRGIDVPRVQDDGYTHTADPLVLDHATELGRLLFTLDDDLLKEASWRQRKGVPFAGVAYCHQLDMHVGRVIDDLELICAATLPGELDNQVIYVPLK